MSAEASPFQGVIPVLPTPFHDDETLDLTSLERIVTFAVEQGVNGLTLLGVLGEANRLTGAERTRLIRVVVQAAPGLPVIVGTSHAGTAATIALSREAADLGAAAIMVAPSKQPAPSDETVFDYFHRVAEKTSLPIVLQDHPQSTEVHMPVSLILRLVQEIPAIACIKAEATPSPSKIAALRAGLIQSGRPVTILTGLGGLYGFFDLERGSDGFNTGFAFPEVLVAIMRCARAGDWDGAYRIYRRYLPLIVFEQQPGLAIRKEILRQRGLLSCGLVRHPGANIDPATQSQLGHLLSRTFPCQDLTKPVRIEVHDVISPAGT
ncbi:MAG: dihydrodipicolinate synthase family protein [Opitutaceae bacterium]|nr:dihydrodipicolinate synthase family protein [Opitutaceae bacterium]